jgi:hypothetical protein
MTQEEAEDLTYYAQNMFKEARSSDNGYRLACTLINWDRVIACDDGDCRTCAIAHAFAMGRVIEVRRDKDPNYNQAYSVNVIDEEGPH